MFKRLRTVLVEDEPLAIKGFLKYIQNNGFIELVAVCENAAEVQMVLDSQKIELIFLDTSMPQISVTDLLARSGKKPVTIITIANPSSVVNMTHTLNFLTKPVSAKSFNLAVSKVYTKIQGQ
jgi:two-component system LytT family response regulator